MTVPFHDILESTRIDGLTCLVEVERGYKLDWDRFDERHRRDLAQIYEGLPGAVRHRDEPWWFGEDEDVPPFLSASLEPTGWLVSSVLPEADWLRMGRAVPHGGRQAAEPGAALTHLRPPFAQEG